MKIVRALIVLEIALGSSWVVAADPALDSASVQSSTSVQPAERGMGHVILAYLPNRIFDLFDLARVRVRLGPGVGAGVRATQLIDVNAGLYTAFFAGLRGPRQQVMVPWPFGVETLTGVELGPAEVGGNRAEDPGYSPTEIGASIHPVLLGLDLGVDPYEVLDMLCGLFLLDPRADDF
jgi:hypothetical protein